MSSPVLSRLSRPEEVLSGGPFDATIVIMERAGDPLPPELQERVLAAAAVDDAVGRETLLLPCPEAAGGRLILAATGPLDRDWADVRSLADAAKAGLRRARAAGAIRPALLLAAQVSGEAWRRSLEVAVLGALQGLWAPLEAREVDPGCEKICELGVLDPEGSVDLLALQALEEGRRLARDLCGTQAERMTPRAFAAVCAEALLEGPVELEILQDISALKRSHPLLMAVARASLAVPRHHPCVLRLRYRPEGACRGHLFLAGKGVTYDTGGADLKVGGHMAGMSRDKGGAAAAAGIVMAAATLQAPVAVTAEIGLVRNSIGADAFVTDEIIRSHAGQRVRIGNTDAEGRLVLADCLSHLRMMALEEEDPQLFSLATLTGHAALAMGPYTAIVENGPARARQTGARLKEAGERWGDPMDLSSLRREDVRFVDAPTAAADLLSCNSAPSSRTPRGHQFPAAFLLRASGLAPHDTRHDKPLPYTHVDIAGSGVEGGDWAFGTPTAAPVVAFAARWLMS